MKWKIKNNENDGNALVSEMTFTYRIYIFLVYNLI